ncbi:hypothetical protein pb186bvf_010502 [Paramecium bursaria]
MNRSRISVPQSLGKLPSYRQSTLQKSRIIEQKPPQIVKKIIKPQSATKFIQKPSSVLKFQTKPPSQIHNIPKTQSVIKFQQKKITIPRKQSFSCQKFQSAPCSKQKEQALNSDYFNFVNKQQNHNYQEEASFLTQFQQLRNDVLKSFASIEYFIKYLLN